MCTLLAQCTPVMIVQCPACASQYQITDDKIRGKTVRLRCKNCGDAWITSGPKKTLGSAVAHSMVVSDDTHDSYRTELPQVSVVTPPGFEAAVLAPPMSGEGRVVEEPEGEVLTPTSNVAKRRRSGAKESRDLFAPKEVAMGGVRESAAPPPMGSRNENSVLFSLATFRESAAPAPASNDHSGIIDIKALVSNSYPPPPAGEVRETPSRIPPPVHSEPPLGAFSREVSSTQSLPAMIRERKVWFAGAGVAAAFVALIGLGVALTGKAPVANLETKNKMAAASRPAKVETAPAAKIESGVKEEPVVAKSATSAKAKSAAKSGGPTMTKVKSPTFNAAPTRPLGTPKAPKKSANSCTDRCGGNLACAIKCTT